MRGSNTVLIQGDGSAVQATSIIVTFPLQSGIYMRSLLGVFRIVINLISAAVHMGRGNDTPS